MNDPRPKELCTRKAYWPGAWTKNGILMWKPMSPLAPHEQTTSLRSLAVVASDPWQ